MCLGALHTGDGLYLLCKHLMQMFVVTGVNLDEQRIIACGVVTFNYFRNILQFLDHLLVFTRR